MKRNRYQLFVSAAGIALSVAAMPASAAPEKAPVSQEASPRVKALLARMTLAEKIDVIRGIEEPAETNQGVAGYLPGVPRLGVKPIRLADGPPGLLTSKPSLAEVATMGLAATFDVGLARENGVIIAEEARRLGVDVVLQPFINLDRDIAFNRGYNTFGEDPMLTGALGAAQIEGVQSRGVMAQAKHFVAYESDAVNIMVDQQTLREVYVAPFDDAVKAGVSSIMCSYNKVNGDWACGNKAVLTDILRGELSFKGFVTSDWGAVHSNKQVPAGMDMEMPGRLPDGNPFAGILPAYSDITPPPHKIPRPNFDMFTRVFVSAMPEEPRPETPNWEETFPVNTGFVNLSEAMKDGSVTVADIDLAASRILRELDRFGRIDGGTAAPPPPAMPMAALEEVNRRTAEKAAVLLKNEGGALPLGKADLDNLAMIGPGARQLVAVGRAGERSLGLIEGRVSPYNAVRKRGGTVTLAIANDMDGVVVPTTVLSSAKGPGLARETGGTASDLDTQVDFTRANGKALPAGSSHRWVGRIHIAEAGEYRLGLQIMGVRGNLYVDGKRVGGSTSYPGALHGDTVQANQDSLLPTTDGLDNIRVPMDFTPGDHDIVLEVESDGSGNPAEVRFTWSTPGKRAADRAAAVAAARKAKKAVVFAWSRGKPTFALPGDQDALIEAVAAANPNTVVVLNTSQPVAMPWIDKVKGVLQMWWTGDQGGDATADLLVGRASPGGRLPFTWGKQLADYPATDPAHPERSAKGVNGMTTYSEGLQIGYRYFEQQGRKPLYPFGHGLSYTQFAYSGLKVSPAANGGMDVRYTVRNTGKTAGDEVSQVYLGAPRAPVPGAAFAVKALAGFTRTSLAPGEARQVTVNLPARRFEYWSVADKAWKRAPADRQLTVGGSSSDARLTAALGGAAAQ